MTIEMGSPRTYLSLSVRSVTRLGEGDDGPLQAGRQRNSGGRVGAAGRALGTAGSAGSRRGVQLRMHSNCCCMASWKNPPQVGKHYTGNSSAGCTIAGRQAAPERTCTPRLRARWSAIARRRLPAASLKCSSLHTRQLEGGEGLQGRPKQAARMSPRADPLCGRLPTAPVPPVVAVRRASRPPCRAEARSVEVGGRAALLALVGGPNQCMCNAAHIDVPDG